MFAILTPVQLPSVPGLQTLTGSHRENREPLHIRKHTRLNVTTPCGGKAVISVHRVKPTEPYRMKGAKMYSVVFLPQRNPPGQ